MQQLQAGMQALQTGNIDAAKNVFRNILSVNSSEVHSLHFLGVAYCQKGNLDDGIALIEQSIRLDPSRFGPYLNLGRFLAGVSKWDRAVAALQQAVQRDANSFDAWSLLAQASFSSGDSDAALIAGKKAAEINPGNAEIFFSLGVYASEKNKDEAIDYYRNAVSIDPASFKAWVNLGNCLLDCQRIEESIAAFNDALNSDPFCFQALMGLCRAYGDLARWVESLAIAQQALSVDPSSHDAAFWVGFSLHKLDRKQDAAIAYRAALNISPVAANTPLYLASALESLGEDQDAIGYYEMATNIDPNLYLAFNYWGALLEKGGNLSLAIDKYRRAIEVKPDFADAKKALLRCQGENGIRERVSVESYREQMEGEDEAGILIAAYPSFEAIPSNRRSVNSWIEDKNESYFAGQMFGNIFVDLPWVKAKSFAESSSLLIPEPGSEYLDAVDVYRSQIKTLQIRMSQAPVISSLVESVARKKGCLIDVIDVGGWSGNALFLAGFNDSWDVVKSWSVVETSTVCLPAREQLPGLHASLPEGSGGKRNIGKLSFEELDSFYGSSPASHNVDLIWTSTAQHYNACFPRDLDALLSRGAGLVYFDNLPYLCSSNPTFNVCEFTETGVSDQMVSFLMSQKYLTELVVNAANKYGYSFKLWSQYIEPKLVFWQPQDGDQQLPNEVTEDAKPLLMKVCSIRFDKLD